MIHQRHPSLILIGALVTALTTLPPSAHGLRQRHISALGKWKDGSPSEIDCSTSSSDYEYYIERCWDDNEITMWWINGRCINGQKEEVSELHRCMRPDGSRPYCHDCNDGRGNMKNVCGSDSPDKEEVCDIALASTAEDCGDQGMTVYSHQCMQQSGGPNSWYLRESVYCDEEEVYLMGANGEDVPPRAEYTCGKEWYYAYEPGDELLISVNPDLDGVEHPFVSSSNRYCLDCGLAIQVCASEEDATCEDLGLPPKGSEPKPAATPAPVAIEPPTTPAPVETEPPTTPAPVATEPVRTPAPVETEPPTTPAPVATEPATTPAPVATEPATTPAPIATELATPPAPVATDSEDKTPAPVATEPEDTTPAPVATEPEDATPAPVATKPGNVGEVDGVQTRSAASLSSYSLVVVGAIAGWTLSVFM